MIASNKNKMRGGEDKFQRSEIKINESTIKKQFCFWSFKYFFFQDFYISSCISLIRFRLFFGHNFNKCLSFETHFYNYQNEKLWIKIRKLIHYVLHNLWGWLDLFLLFFLWLFCSLWDLHLLAIVFNLDFFKEDFFLDCKLCKWNKYS